MLYDISIIVCISGHDDISDLLIEHGADINAQMNNGMSPLMIACHSVSLYCCLSNKYLY